MADDGGPVLSRPPALVWSVPVCSALSCAPCQMGLLLYRTQSSVVEAAGRPHRRPGRPSGCQSEAGQPRSSAHVAGGVLRKRKPVRRHRLLLARLESQPPSSIVRGGGGEVTGSDVARPAACRCQRPHSTARSHGDRQRWNWIRQTERPADGRTAEGHMKIPMAMVDGRWAMGDKGHAGQVGFASRPR